MLSSLSNVIRRLPSSSRHYLKRPLRHYRCSAAVLSSEKPSFSPPPLSQEQKDKVEQILEKIKWLDVVEVHLLTELIFERMGQYLTNDDRSRIRQAAFGEDDEDARAGSQTKAPESVEIKPKIYDLKLTGFDAKSKIKVIKEVRTIGGLGLKEAKEVVESAPKVIMKELKGEEAEKLKKQLEDVGATVEMVEV